MEGLFYYQDYNGITFLFFYPDRRVVSFGKSNSFNQYLHTCPWLNTDSDIYHFSNGIYRVNLSDNIKVIIKENYGKIVYRGTLKDKNTIALSYKCPITNFVKSMTYKRFSEKNYILNKKLIDICVN